MTRSTRILLFIALLLAGDAAGSSAEVGRPAPDFTATDSNGRTHRLSAYRGKIVVLEWTNHDCPFVRKHYNSGNMQAQQKAATEQAVIWLSIISSARGRQGHVNGFAANGLTKSRGAAPTAVLLDPEGLIGRLYAAKTTPHMFIVDAEGKLVYKGAIDSIGSTNPGDIQRAIPYVRIALKQLLAGKRVSKRLTPPYGCAVKY